MNRLIELLSIFFVIDQAHGHLVPIIYAAPSAVSHQSRIDIKHSSGIPSPLVYTPLTTIYATHPKPLLSETVFSPVLATDTLLTPVALSVFHNFPLARALEHPISLDKVQKKTNFDTLDTVKLDKKLLLPVPQIHHDSESKDCEDSKQVVADKASLENSH
ncbi:hypothetical protein O0L34_g18308 [Tuta absoluta]|nr:hypothetical protein O0L34_g18308 [Tuta absoluta]